MPRTPTRPRPPRAGRSRTGPPPRPGRASPATSRAPASRARPTSAPHTRPPRAARRPPAREARRRGRRTARLGNRRARLPGLEPLDRHTGGAQHALAVRLPAVLTPREPREPDLLQHAVELAPQLERTPGGVHVERVGPVQAADEARLAAGFGPRMTGLEALDQRDLPPVAREPVGERGAEDAGADDDRGGHPRSVLSPPPAKLRLTALFAAPVNRLITELARLPGIGQRTAQRLAFHILSASEEEALGLAEAIREVKATVGHCEVCFNLATESTCRICQDERREQATICVVEQPSDVIPIERSGEFHGRYHVLGGALSPIDGVDPEDLHIAELLGRVDNGTADPRGRDRDERDHDRRGHRSLPGRRAARARARGGRDPAGQRPAGGLRPRVRGRDHAGPCAPRSPDHLARRRIGAWRKRRAVPGASHDIHRASACPHDCPDTCAMHVTVEDGRALKVAGDPDHPITVGFLCGKVSNYLDRVYSDHRILHPLVREDGALPARHLGRGARPRGRGAPRGARRVRRRVDPPVQLHGHAGPDPGQHDVRARDERARRLVARANDLRHGRDHRHASGTRRVAGGRPGGVAERPLPPDLGLEPAVHRAAPLAQAARRAQPGSAARGGGSLPQPHGPRSPTSTCARCRAPTPPSPSG